mmetsp:Transcript_4912/g.14648  ORF Transcript_4912/g.14648 Transcript_4912/m.14648 type:complete len:261 (-) Transcript_4912:47-829(-)
MLVQAPFEALERLQLDLPGQGSNEFVEVAIALAVCKDLLLGCLPRFDEDDTELDTVLGWNVHQRRDVVLLGLLRLAQRVNAADWKGPELSMELVPGGIAPDREVLLLPHGGEGFVRCCLADAVLLLLGALDWNVGAQLVKEELFVGMPRVEAPIGKVQFGLHLHSPRRLGTLYKVRELVFDQHDRYLAYGAIEDVAARGPFFGEGGADVVDRVRGHVDLLRTSWLDVLLPDVLGLGCYRGRIHRKTSLSTLIHRVSFSGL